MLDQMNKPTYGELIDIFENSLDSDDFCSYIILILYQGEDFMTLYVALLHQQEYLSLENAL